jgi:hypothetical protein
MSNQHLSTEPGQLHVSIDTVDRELLRKIRRHVDVDRILANIVRIRSVAINDDLPAPQFHFSTGLFDKSVSNLRELAAMAIALSIGSIVFWDLVEYDRDTNATDVFAIRGLTTIEEHELTPLLATLDSALQLLQRHGVSVSIAGGAVQNLLDRYRSVVHERDPPEKQNTATEVEDMSQVTRDCTDPWTMVVFRGDGGIAPCCRRPPIGTLTEDSLPTILNGDKARELKANLLSGRLDDHCMNCQARAMTSPAQLAQKVSALVANRAGLG